MNINNILEKYWNAEASLQEEAELRAYFSGNDVAPEHEQYKSLFSFFSESRLQSTDLDVESILSKFGNVDSILEKYWNAEASLEEESLLKQYFTSGNIAPGHIQYKELFSLFDENSTLTTDIDIAQVINQNNGIDQLLEKYWNTDTSLEEEQILKDYFIADEVAPEHEQYRSLFNAYKLKSNETCSLDIESIITKADSELGNRAIGSMPMPSEAKTRVFSLQKWALGLAAIFILGFAAITVMNQSVETTQYKGHATVLDEEAEAQEAYEITKEALAFLSKNMNKGSKTVKESVSKAENVKIFKY